MTFVDDIMQSDAAYKDAMTVKTLEEAYQRRNRGVDGFMKLKEAFEQSESAGRAALERFYRLAAERTAPLRENWREIVTHGSLAEAQNSLVNLDALDAGQIDFLFQAQQHLIHAGDYAKLGFCGHLNRYFDPATLGLEGVTKKN